MNKVLKYGDQADRGHFRLNDDPWNLNLMYQLERECIYHHMEETAGDMWKNKDKQTALKQADPIMNAIKGNYAPEGSKGAPAPIWNKALSGELKKECPKDGTILTFVIAFWIALLVEIVVMGVQAAFSDEINYFIFVLAVILGLGGFLQGKGIGILLFARWMNRTDRNLTEPMTQNWILLAIGSVLILTVSAIRGSGGADTAEFFLVFFITLFFGEAVAICEAIAVDFSKRREICQTEFSQAQRTQAEQTHTKNLDEGIYKKDYEQFVDVASTKKYQRNPEIDTTIAQQAT